MKKPKKLHSRSSSNINRSRAQDKIAKENARLAKRLGNVKASKSISKKTMKAHAKKTSEYASNIRLYGDRPSSRSAAAAAGSGKLKRKGAGGGSKSRGLKLPPAHKLVESRHSRGDFRDDAYTNYFVSTNQLPPSMLMKTSALNGGDEMDDAAFMENYYF